MPDEVHVDGNWWNATVARQGHTGWSDQQVYDYDQPVRRAAVARAIAAHPRPLAGVDVADIGCGTGDFTLMLAGCGAKVLAIDFSSAVIEVARRRSAAHGDAVRFACASVTQIPATNASMDLVTSITVLQHLVRDEDLRLGVGEVARVLRPDGRVIILELAPPISVPKRAPDGHVIERPAASWLQSFESAGLVVEREFAYPQFGITALRLLATGIDRLRGGGNAPPAGSNAEVATIAAPGFNRKLLRTGLWLLRSALLSVAWPLDYLLKLQVPPGHRYYRLWILKKKD